ncbi:MULTISPECIES: carbohydrate kinase family protein [Prochlorococcus]|uniref:Sugar kinase, ribokinase family n=1 Tax=Prochlorococcus marinus (strain SARG / CCMP1375 / SS120) TaxID=167539 RepID=Q7V9P1_PROMA|nr:MULTISPECIES: carbohydrate kinase [Prochlorococcus]AAQ00832.1 Sugar kinase, ribokinase family [Prochlorococcus marinus subsp. marinus str. CCMP1375]KGG10673.1 Fructokinase [Prochlorococcus marinus str. LG]KGG21094.1 Fructokinase [Prochlorococcus marinus str. SS2]KGG31821.1 Fructokinase [Prochlorococcus marinus str. SS51]KGG36014.1 Fructokinase [Prochlorococcus sp. SS52]
MKNPNVICFGEALVDRLGPLGGDPASDKPVDDCLGGAPANVASGLARLGINAAFVGCLGNDSIGNQFRELFMARGVNFAGLQIHESLLSRIVLVYRDLNGERSFGGFAGDQSNIFADQYLDLNVHKKIFPSLLDEAKWLLLGTIPLAVEHSREVVQWTIEQSLNNGLQIAFDLNWRPTFWDINMTPNNPPDTKTCSLITSFLEHASLIKLAKEEAEWFFNSKDPWEISNALPEKPSVIVTDGAQPINWVLGGFSGQTPALSPQKVVDTTGAGDAFMAGLMTQIISFSSQPKLFSEAEAMIQFSAGCGALVCGAPGAIEPQPSYSEVQSLLSSFLNDRS